MIVLERRHYRLIINIHPFFLYYMRCIIRPSELIWISISSPLKRFVWLFGFPFHLSYFRCQILQSFGHFIKFGIICVDLEESWESSLCFFLSLLDLVFNLSDAKILDSTSMVASCMDIKVVDLLSLNRRENYESNSLA